MPSEVIHSVVDTSNEVLRLYEFVARMQDVSPRLDAGRLQVSTP